MKNERPNSVFASELTGVSNVAMMSTTNTTNVDEINDLMHTNKLFPTTKLQADMYINSEYGCLGELGMEDVERIESLLGKYGMQGRYQYTKSHLFVRFLSTAFLEKALKLEYAL